LEWDVGWWDIGWDIGDSLSVPLEQHAGQLDLLCDRIALLCGRMDILYGGIAILCDRIALWDNGDSLSVPLEQPTRPTGTGKLSLLLRLPILSKKQKKKE